MKAFFLLSKVWQTVTGAVAAEGFFFVQPVRSPILLFFCCQQRRQARWFYDVILSKVQENCFGDTVTRPPAPGLTHNVSGSQVTWGHRQLTTCSTRDRSEKECIVDIERSAQWAQFSPGMENKNGVLYAVVKTFFLSFISSIDACR